MKFIQHISKIAMATSLLASGTVVASQTPGNAPTMPPPSISDVILKLEGKPTPIDLKAGLQAHYPYSGNAKDHSGNGHHLKVNGSTPTEDRFGMPNSAYAFDGKNDFMFADLEERKGDFTLSLWAKAENVEQSRYRSIINIHDKTPGSKHTCQIHTSGGRYPTYQFFSSNPESFALVKAEWQHLAVTVSGKVIRFFENGRRVYSQELEGGEANKFSNIIIGRNRNRKRHFKGAIDDVYVYNRAINDAEVERLFDGGLEDSDGDGLTDAYEKGYGRYAAIKGNFDWAGAKADAEKRGGHIATITSEAEWHAVKEVLGEIPHGYYLGGTDEKTEGVWEWITGEAWKFTKWAKGEPNNLPRKQYGDEDYTQTWTKTSDGNRLWNDIYGKKNPWSKGYILEYGYYTDPTLADSDNDGVNDGEETAAKTDPNNPLSRPAPKRKAPPKAPSPPPGPDYIKKIEELTKANADKAAKIKNLEASEKVHLKAIADLNATNESLKKNLETQSKTIANLKAENTTLKQRIINSQQEMENVSYKLNKTEEKLQAAIDVARTPFVNGWVYDPKQGWLFTDSNNYPLVYSQATESWHYYEMGTAEPRLFYSYKDEVWEAWDPIPEQDKGALAKGNNN